MIRSKSVNDFLDFESREDFAVSKSRTSLSVPNAHRDQDFRRNSNISCETSSSYYSESNEHLITGNHCDSLTLPEILHVAVLGDRGVGKHTLLHYFRDTEDMWSDLTDFEEDTEICVSLDGKETSLLFVEQQNLENVEACGYMDAIVVVYSVADIWSFKLANKIVGEIRKHSQKPVILVANKVDLARGRTVSTKDGEKVATRFSCKYMEISLVLNHNVDDLLVGIARQARAQSRHDSSNLSSSTEKQRNKVRQFTNKLVKRWRKIRPKRSRCNNLFDA